MVFRNQDILLANFLEEYESPFNYHTLFKRRSGRATSFVLSDNRRRGYVYSLNNGFNWGHQEEHSSFWILFSRAWDDITGGHTNGWLTAELSKPYFVTNSGERIIEWN